MSQSPPSSRTSFGNIPMTYSADLTPPVVGFPVSIPFSSPALPVDGALSSTPAWDFMPSALQDDRDPLSYFNPPSSVDLSPSGLIVTDHSDYSSSVALSPALTTLPQSPSSPLAPPLPVSSGLLMTSPFAQPQTVLATSQAMDVGGKCLGYKLINSFAVPKSCTRHIHTHKYAQIKQTSHTCAHGPTASLCRNPNSIRAV